MIVDPKVLQAIPNSENQTCFGCGANNPHGLKMKFSTDGERVYSFMRAPDFMTGWDQTVHGGILSTMLDEVMGWGGCVSSQKDRHDQIHNGQVQQSGLCE
jgi:hypothetical protein